MFKVKLKKQASELDSGSDEEEQDIDKDLGHWKMYLLIEGPGAVLEVFIYLPKLHCHKVY